MEAVRLSRAGRRGLEPPGRNFGDGELRPAGGARLGGKRDRRLGAGFPRRRLAGTGRGATGRWRVGRPGGRLGTRRSRHPSDRVAFDSSRKRGRVVDASRGQRLDRANQRPSGRWIPGRPRATSRRPVKLRFFLSSPSTRPGTRSPSGSQFAESSEVVHAATRSAGGTWEPALEISPVPGASYVPQAPDAIDPSGNTIGVWRLHTASLAIVQAAVHPAGRRWEPPQDLTEPPPLPPLPDCIVPNVLRKTLLRSRTVIEESNCLLGRVRRAYSRKVRKGRVVSQSPRTGEVLANGALVDLVVSRGRRSARS